MAELTIMNELEQLVNDIFCGCDDCPRMGNGCGKCITVLKKRLPDAVKREIVRVLEEIRMLNLCLYRGGNENFKEGFDRARSYFQDIMRSFIAKYAPASQYCAGIQEAIDKGIIKRASPVYNSKYYWHYKNGDAMNFVNRCPFCKEGENCIGGKE